MQIIDLFLREHAAVHSKCVAPADMFNMDYLIKGLSDAQMRACPHGLNSMAWLLWHMARTEDGMAGCLVGGRTQVLDEPGWAGRLGVESRTTASGMTKLEVAAVSAAVDLQALWEYRCEVGRRTRAIVADLWPDRWEEPVTVADIRRAAAAGVVEPEAAANMERYLPGKSRESCLMWWGLNHSLIHLGQMQALRALLDRSANE